MSGDDKTDDQSGVYNVPDADVERTDLAPITTGHVSTMSATTAWIERRRLEQIKKTQGEHLEVVKQSIELNISLGDLAESERYKATAIDALHDLPRHVIRERGRREKEEDLADIKQDTELAKARRKLREQQEKLDAFDASNEPLDEVYDATAEASHIILGARITDLKKNIEAEIERAKNENYYTESYQETLEKDLDAQIQKLREQYLP